MSKTDQLARQQIALPNSLKIPRGMEEAFFPRIEDNFEARASDSRCTYFCVDLWDSNMQKEILLNSKNLSVDQIQVLAISVC